MHITVTKQVIIDNLYVDTVFGRDLLENILRNYGPEAWNSFSDRLRRWNIWAMYSTPEPTDDDDACMPVCLRIDLSGEDFRGVDFSGLDLYVPHLDGADFSGAKLTRTRLSSVAYVSFRDADLREADFEGADITGADFAGARLDGARFEHGNYDGKKPPVNLAAEHLAKCSPFPPHWDRDRDATDDEPRDPLVVRQAQLRSFWGRLSDQERSMPQCICPK